MLPSVVMGDDDALAILLAPILPTAAGAAAADTAASSHSFLMAEEGRLRLFPLFVLGMVRSGWGGGGVRRCVLRWSGRAGGKTLILEYYFLWLVFLFFYVSGDEEKIERQGNTILVRLELWDLDSI